MRSSCGGGRVRIVSLVPSLTETLWELGVGDRIVGVTKFCVLPENARDRAMVVGGTKDPDLPKIEALRPDLVVVDEDENKPEHVQAMRGFADVFLTRIESVSDAARAVAALGIKVGREHDAEARSQRILERESQLRSLTRMLPPISCFVPIWKKPLMTMGGHTYMDDLLAVAGGRNVFHSSGRKYFEAPLEELRSLQPESVLLPTEPYRFREKDRAEYANTLDLPLGRVRVVDGQAFTWFGTRSLIGLDVVADAVTRVRAGDG